MDIASRKTSQEARSGALAGFSRLAGSIAKAVGGLAPSSISARIKVEAEAQAVAAVIVRAAERADARAAKSMLDDAWKVYGAKSFSKAMSARCWSIPATSGQEIVQAVLLTTPAEVVARLSSSEWVAKLADLVPDKNWSDRTLEDCAYNWSMPEEASKRGIKLASVGPLARICANERSDGWVRSFEVVGAKLGSPEKAEILACMSMLDHHQRQFFEAWAESRAIREHVQEPQAGLTHGRSKPRL